MKFLPKHHYYIPLKNRPNHHYYRPQKIEKISEKKIVRNFLQKIKFLFFFEFFSENVLKTLLRGRETTRKKYRIVFEKFLKYVMFFDFACPSIHHPSITHPSIQVGDPPGTPEAGVTSQTGMPQKLYLMIYLSSELKSESDSKINFLFFFFLPLISF